ncbi:AraC family transcriptional regulator [Nitrospirillum sp. BR 11164]|uniref:helix-turn-helix domain-containing protein n=1 Tax=Nitrospirillum sp. BR 11164 TaxID=3104324 RepID=UPI002AFE6E13|nr:AraC family transcriptional regulator [Nitrospirillum sp. BR 11164]MEA1648490.1 AraC family transcriptional regulator [Nitrospirillum sp. BR 11164]
MPHLTAAAAPPNEIGEEPLVQSLLDLLESAGGDVDWNPEAAKYAIRRASAILRVELERSAVACGTDGGGLAPWQVRRVTAYMEEHLSEHISVKKLGEVARRSASHFCRAFKRTMGETPYSFITRRRLALAQRMMLTSDAPLSEIAISCGFSDQSHFSNRFRDATGQSPAAWRRERRERAGRLKEPYPIVAPVLGPAQDAPDVPKVAAISGAMIGLEMGRDQPAGW